MFFKAPVDSLVISAWGSPRPYRGVGAFHEGLDFRAKIGTPVRAAASGVVTVSKNALNDPAGEMITIEHPKDGNQTYVSRYMHLSKRLVKVGDRVAQGDLIGYSGASGIKESEAHLHFDVRTNNPDEFARLYGTPKPWPGKSVGGFYGVPAEAIMEVNLDPKVKAASIARGVAIYAGASILLPVILIAGAYIIWKRYGR